MLASLSHGTLAALYLVGASFEIAGITFVVIELRRDTRAAKAVKAWKRPHFGESPLEAMGRHSTMTYIQQQTDPAGYQRQQTGALRRRSQHDAMAAAASIEELRGIAIDGLVGNRWLRIFGVALIGVGVLVATIGNLAAL
jgi:hypothetical protein